MKTSNFKECGRNPEAVAICRGVPAWYKGRRYIELAPTWAMLKLPREEFEAAYRSEILEKLDPTIVLDQLGIDSIILCWEPTGVYCHRRIVAEWLEAECGVIIPEFGHDRSESMPSALMPSKGEKKPKKQAPQAELF